MGRRALMTLERLEQLGSLELKEEWARFHGAPAPSVTPDLLRLGIAYRLQEKKQGGLSRESKRLLRQAVAIAQQDNATAAPLRRLTPGTRLVRDWHGAGHTVTVLDEGFEYDGRTWRSLTAIAKAITGTHRNGPRFFGLTGNAA
ncbi:DUF2924 domain-containing protein [Erythrobacter sp. sf7]|uniref:DUF2924 domain-containing protein n=1 Tax=Erythrobacter fulvus TaxID=2987523 RepID=A0ABT5JPR6_9SPHN|nr:DUF2924 domain-containing protein [Erythrobacter fulvus]MDC8754771.1 DUF2924 domain-containing protein [Erythrobacter fulvus]